MKELESIYNIFSSLKNKRVCIICFGPLENMDSGYLLRVNDMIDKFSTQKDMSVIVLEFVASKSKQNSIKLDKQRTFIRIKYMNMDVEEFYMKIHKKSLKILRILLNNIYFILRISALLLKNKNIIYNSDIIVIESAIFIPALILARLLNKYVIIDIHPVSKLMELKNKNKNIERSIRILLWDIIERFAIKISNLVLVVSDREKEFIVNAYKCPKEKIHVVPLTPKPSKTNYNLEYYRKQLDLQGYKIVTFVGSLYSIANYEAVKYIVEKLAPYIRKYRKDVAFLIIGRGQELFNDTNTEYIKFIGSVKQTDLAPYILLSDICIAPMMRGQNLPSTKVKEYLAYNKPVLSTTVYTGDIDKSKLNKLTICNLNDFHINLLKLINEL